jgi:3-deoxy-D-manno-octulosonic-acid transferase
MEAKNNITVLSPGKGCWKTKKIIGYIERFLSKYRIKSEITVETDIKQFFKYRTWILPTIIINGKIVARGYKPSEKKLFETLKK